MDFIASIFSLFQKHTSSNDLLFGCIVYLFYFVKLNGGNQLLFFKVKWNLTDNCGVDSQTWCVIGKSVFHLMDNELKKNC